MNPWAPVAFTARPMDGSDLGCQATVVDLAGARLSVRPFVVPTARNPEGAAKPADVVIGPLRVHKLEVYELCFAKKAAPKSIRQGNSAFRANAGVLNFNVFRGRSFSSNET
jgi:hypothetical protein